MKTLLTIFLLIAHSGHAWGAESLDPDRIRGFFVYPLSSLNSLKGAWIDVVGCDEQMNCGQLIHRIPVRELKTAGTLSPEIDRYGGLRLTYQNTESQTVTIGTTTLKGGWFPRFELCPRQSTGTQCRLELQRNTEKKSLSLTLFMGEE